MKQWLWDHADSLARIGRRLSQTPVSSAFTVLVIGIALSLPAGLYTLLKNVHALSANIKQTPEISLFLSADTTHGEITKLQAELKRLPGIAEVRWVKKDEALRNLQKRHSLGDLIAGLKQNPLPDVLIVRPEEGDPHALQKLRAELATRPSVDLAQTDSAWAEKLAAFLNLGDISVSILATLLGIALIAIVGNTIRLQMLTHRNEIEVSRLIGATDGFIRRPFLYYGAIQGLAGGLLAWLIVILAAALLQKNALKLLELYGIEGSVQTLGLKEGLFLLGGAILLGWIGAFTAVNRHLRSAG